MSTVEIVVLVVAILMFGGLGTLLIRFERSEKDGKGQGGDGAPGKN